MNTKTFFDYVKDEVLIFLVTVALVALHILIALTKKGVEKLLPDEKKLIGFLEYMSYATLISSYFMSSLFIINAVYLAAAPILRQLLGLQAPSGAQGSLSPQKQ